MDSTMKIPFKVSTTTSNFMIGVTAAASAVVYLQRGYNPGIAFPVVLGVLAGALTGAKILPKINPKILRIIFAVAITAVAIEMIINGINHKF